MSGSAAYERTRLAWRRTVLTASVVAILSGRLAIESQSPAVAAVLLALSAAVWVALFAVAQRRIHRLDAGIATPPSSTFPLVGSLICGYAVLSAILVLRAG